jgi:hypothetical protein
MAFDFKKLAKGGAFTSITDPAALFDALPNKAPGYGYLRAVQKTVLDAWSPRRDERDLVIKTNTGGGKTIAGLLILQCCLNERMAPAVYLAPDPHLARRVVEESESLGLTVVTDPGSPKFFSGEAICVTTMQTLINGRSRFGVAGAGGREPVRVRAVVVDDAHAALALTEDQTTLRIPANHEAYGALLDLFEDDLRQQSLNALMDIRDGDRSAVLRIPFWSWHTRQEQVLRVLRPHRTESAFIWSWPLVSDLVHLCQAVVSADAVEIVPPCPPIEKFPSFAEADRRVYLTATLADDSVLVTHFDANPKSVTTSIVPDSAADLGDRLVLAPQELNPAISHDDVRAAVRALADEFNVVVLVPSHRQASIWGNEADMTVSKADEIGDAVERLKAGRVGLVVIVNRYDGIDLPDAACRVLVIDGLPQAYTAAERREAVALRDSDAMVTRQLQRLEQGMGRGVRSRDDRCAVVLLGARLTQLVARADVADRLSPATRAQLGLSRRVASDLEGSDMPSLSTVIKQVVEGDAGFRELSREALVGVTYGPAYLSPTAEPLRKAYNDAVAGRLDDAVENAEAAVAAAEASGDRRLAGWVGETLASYVQPIDAVRAQRVLAGAAKKNPAVLHPIAGLSYKRVKSGGEQSAQAAGVLAVRYSDGQAFLLGVEALIADLVWDNDRTDTTEAALADLAEHLGWTSQMPERDFGCGSDVLWALGGKKYAVVEAKSGATGNLIWKKDINQLAGSVNWCRQEYGSDAQVTPVMMHPTHVVEKAGTPPSGARVLTAAKLDELKAGFRGWAAALARNSDFRAAPKIEEQLRQHGLLAAEFFPKFTTVATRQR